MPSSKKRIVQTPLFPLYSEVRLLLKIWRHAVSKADLLALINAVWDQTGTPQNPVDWSNPDHWIEERLAGQPRALAEKVWRESKKTINPRHLYGSYLFINGFKLMEPDVRGILGLTERGAKFLAEDPDAVRELDELEGIPQLLGILAKRSPAKSGDLHAEWGEFLLIHSKYRTPATIKGTLRQRILNSVERGYISRDGNTYTITEKGLAYASNAGVPGAQQPHRQVLEAAQHHNATQIAALRDLLGKMHPYRFESLVKDLLEAMDYEDVVVTKQSGDKGVDVVANFEFGITRVREVVQVKRHQGSISRPTLDQLRGALPYHQAIRGTIITLGKFAQGCKDAAFFPGAAPITLIDGDKLIELMLKHEVGIKKRPLILHEVDESYFAENGTDELLTPQVESAAGEDE